MSDAESIKRINLIRGVVISTIGAAAGYLAFSFWAGWQGVEHAFAQVGWFGLAVAIGLSLLNYVLRFIRWQAYLAALGHAIPAGPSLAIYLSGFALTTTPGKAGELVRGLFLKAHDVPYFHAAAAFLSERLSDLMAVVLIALPGVFFYPSGRYVVAAAIIGIAALAIVLAQKRIFVTIEAWLRHHRSRLAQTAGQIIHLMLDARRCHTPGLLLFASILALLAWMAEALAFDVVLSRLGLSFGIWFAMPVYALATLAGALSFLPGGFGGAEAVMVALLLLKGVPEPTAVAATIIIRLTTIWFAVAVGLLVMSAGRRRFLQPSLVAR
jgi:uncharacterized protein (TIRG00374 family)